MFWNSLGSGFLNPLFNDTSHRIGAGSDFFQFYQAGSDILKGHSIYQTEGKKLTVPYAALYKYPPFLAYSVGIVSQYLNFWTAYKIWIVAIVFFFALMLVLIYKIIDDPDAFFWILIFSMMYTPFYIDLYMGQTNTLMGLFVAGIMFSFLKNRKIMNIIFLSLSLNIKLNTAFLIPAYFNKTQIKKVWFVIPLSLILFIPYFLFFPKDIGYFINYVFGSPLDYFYQAGNVGIYPLISEISYVFTYNINFINAVQILWGLTVILFTLWVQLRLKNRQPDMLDLVSLWLCAFFISYKFIWEHHLVMLIPVLAMEFKKNNRKVIGFLWFLLGIPTVFYFLNMNLGKSYTEIQPFWTEAQSVLYHSCKIIPLVTLYICVLRRLFAKKNNIKAVLVSYSILICAVFIFYNIKPISARDYIAVAKTAFVNKDYERAHANFKRAINTDPYYINTWMEYISFLSSIGEREKMRECVVKAYKLNPDNELFKNLFKK